MKEVPMF